ncbi:MAG: hypothetical protein H7146_12075 [Burkholderiaceae bacterium]|nr:hypothetical protein [Microbacteriaceae bacterium]
MLAMTGTIHAAGSIPGLGELCRGIRRTHEHLLLAVDQMLVFLPAVGTVLVTEKDRDVTVDVVADTHAELSTRVALVEAALRSTLPLSSLRLDWRKAGAIPVPFR